MKIQRIDRNLSSVSLFNLRIIEEIKGKGLRMINMKDLEIDK